MAQAEDPQTRSDATHDDLQAAYERLRGAWTRDGGLPVKDRKRLLKSLKKAVKTHQTALADAISADFGNRSRAETQLAEVFIVLESIKFTLAHLDEWVEPDEREISWHLQPAKGKVVFQPLGVVGIISPWNYPFQLALLPLVAAISAGNRCLIKPSEYTPAHNKVMRTILAEVFSPDVVDVVEGGPGLGAAFSSVPWDHLIFTGSTSVGRHVMRAAAEHLTPVTLELGGKSPAIVHESFSVSKAAERIGWGKTYNAGQTCIAPDYLLAPTDKVDALADAIAAWISGAYPTLRDNPDYTSIIHDGHNKRIRALIADAEAKGATVRVINPAGEDVGLDSGKLAPTLVLGVTDDMEIMHEEIFGPVLPIVGVADLDAALAYVNARPRPLALYYFDHSKKRQNRVLADTTSGGACINDVLLHNTQEELPFGGVGPSGMGSYHGRQGFLTFSHQKSVLLQSRLAGTKLLNPPYGGVTDAVMKLFTTI